jgi:hypothetical protein
MALRAGALAVVFALLMVAPAAAGSISKAGNVRDRILDAQQSATPAIDLRVGLGRILGEHAFLLMEASRAAATDPDREAFVFALDANSTALHDRIASVYGNAPAAAFTQLWQQHIEQLLAYGDATRAGDGVSEQLADSALDKVSASLGGLLAKLNPDIDAGEAAAAFRAHAKQVAAFTAGDYADAYAAHRAAFADMFEFGDALALEIARQNIDTFPDAVAAFSPRVDLRLALDQLLGEHLVLAALAMRAGVKGTPDLEAAAASLDDNTMDLAAAIGDVYGPDVAEQFKGMWSSHVDAYLEFVQALGANDNARRAASLSTLHAYHEQIAALFAELNPELQRSQVSDLIRRHIQALITQAEATKAGDPGRAVAATLEGYERTFEVGAVVADAVAKQFPERYPERQHLPPTDLAPTEVPFARWLAVLAAVPLSLGIQLALIGRLRALRSAASRTR